jgi:RecA-family ATPase
LNEEKSSLLLESFQKEIDELKNGTWEPDETDLGIKPFFHGKKLREAIDKALDEKVVLIEGFCYEGGVLQIFADDGLGKSTVLLNAMIEASAGLPVFKSLPCPRPLKIIWNCAERPLDEPFQRIKLMENAIKPNFENIVFDDEIQSIDITEKKGFGEFMLRLTELASVFENNKVDIIVIDPIYAITGGDLSSPQDVHTINHLIRMIQKRFGCFVIYTHHTNRGQRKENSEERHQGDMYGNRFLRANVTAQYHLRKTDDGTELHNTKDTNKNLLTSIPLVYDEITQTSSVSQDSGDFNKRDRILLFLRKKHAERKEFVLREISNQLKVSDAYIRTTISHMLKTGHIINKAAKGLKAVYFVEKGV